jgi:hypothetical protein
MRCTYKKVSDHQVIMEGQQKIDSIYIVAHGYVRGNSRVGRGAGVSQKRKGER